MKATAGERCPSCGKMKSKIIDTRMKKRVSEAKEGMLRFPEEAQMSLFDVKHS